MVVTRNKKASQSNEESNPTWHPGVGTQTAYSTLPVLEQNKQMPLMPALPRSMHTAWSSSSGRWELVYEIPSYMSGCDLGKLVSTEMSEHPLRAHQIFPFSQKQKGRVGELGFELWSLGLNFGIAWGTLCSHDH